MHRDEPRAVVTSSQPEFVRAISLTDAVMLVAGSMIGSGIFIVSADIARTVGSPFWLLMVWVLTGVITLLGALAYAGAGGGQNLCQSNWIRDKGLGMGRHAPRIVSPLTGEPAAVAKPWIDDAKARLAANNAGALLTGQAIARLAGSTGGTQ